MVNTTLTSWNFPAVNLFDEASINVRHDLSSAFQACEGDNGFKTEIRTLHKYDYDNATAVLSGPVPASVIMNYVKDRIRWVISNNRWLRHKSVSDRTQAIRNMENAIDAIGINLSYSAQATVNGDFYRYKECGDGFTFEEDFKIEFEADIGGEAGAEVPIPSIVLVDDISITLDLRVRTGFLVRYTPGQGWLSGSINFDGIRISLNVTDSNDNEWIDFGNRRIFPGFNLIR